MLSYLFSDDRPDFIGTVEEIKEMYAGANVVIVQLRPGRFAVWTSDSVQNGR